MVGIQKQTTLENIMDSGKGRDYAWEFFHKFNTVSGVSKIVYNKMYKKRTKKKKESFNYYLVIERFNDWLSNKYFDTDTIKGERKGKGQSKYEYPLTNYIFNLNPLFDFAKTRLKEGFTHEQKIILEVLFISEDIREHIYKNYKETDDLVTALIKFYVGYFMKRRILVGLYNSKAMQKRLKIESKKAFGTYDIREDLFSFGVPYPSSIKKDFESQQKHAGNNSNYIKLDLTGLKVVDLTKLSFTEHIRYYLKNSYISPYMYYIFYEDFQIKLKEIMKDLDFKMLDILLNQKFSNKN
jgi:hypothetical protein